MFISGNVFDKGKGPAYLFDKGKGPASLGPIA
jgi:hypothetical protein